MNVTDISRSNKFRRRGYSLLELLIVVAALSSVTAMAVFHFSGATDSVNTVKLRQDVAALNGAVRTYLSQGGELQTASTGEAVIAKLKTVALPSQQATMAGLRGSMIDLRLRGVASTGGNGSARAVWDPVKQIFSIAETGAGFSRFVLDEAPANLTAESRRVLLPMSSEDNWIWSFEDRSHAPPAPRAAPTGVEAPIVAATVDPAVNVLRSPEFSLPGALYDFGEFKPDLKVSLVDRNTPATSETWYSVANGPWVRWNGLPLSIPAALTTELRAFSSPLDPDRYEQSAIAEQVYETIFFAGTTSGTFSNPKGDSGMVTNIGFGQSNSFFTWGNPAASLGYTQPNSLKFTGRSLGTTAPDQTFELGTLTYYNGTTFSGTNATSVELNVKLNLTTPGVTENLPFTFKLLSTPNTKSDKLKDRRNRETEQQMDDADADYVYIPSVSTKFNTVIKGKTFYLVLSFGSNSTSGFTTIDEFHTHENKTMTGSIFGRFTTTPPAG